ncbi:MAG: ABC transporter ATP-binding protein [Mycoplasmatales bacterium]
MINLKNINKMYGKRTIFDNYSLQINRGELVAIVGKSGKGKSTLLNIIGGLEDVDSGEIIIDNTEIKSSKAKKILLREKISYLFQNYALIESETVLNNLLLAVRYKRKTKKEKIILISKALKIVGLEGIENEKIYNLSGGEQQRVAMARLIIKDSRIILADEPTGNLDFDNAKIIFALLKKLNTKGKTVIIVTHDLELANKCKRVIEL